MGVIFDVLKEHELFHKHSKCEFLLRSIALQGHNISSENKEVDPRKTKPTKNRPAPLTTKNIRNILGPVEYYRRFFDGFDSISYPFNTLIQNKCKV